MEAAFVAAPKRVPATKVWSWNGHMETKQQMNEMDCSRYNENKTIIVCGSQCPPSTMEMLLGSCEENGRVRLPKPTEIFVDVCSG